MNHFISLNIDTITKWLECKNVFIYFEEYNKLVYFLYCVEIFNKYNEAKL